MEDADVLEDVSINYLAVALGALVYYILGAIWYAPDFFGHRWVKHDEVVKEQKHTWKTGAYVGELVVDLIIAYVLALFIKLSGAEKIVDGVIVALWVWIGFVATTQFSAVLWTRKTVKSFFIHACFMLVGLLAMSATIMYLA